MMKNETEILNELQLKIRNARKEGTFNLSNLEKYMSEADEEFKENLRKSVINELESNMRDEKDSPLKKTKDVLNAEIQQE